MKTIRSVKLKITSQHQEFNAIAEKYLSAANWLSKIVFNRKKITATNKLQKEFYATIREKFHLPSQVTCALFRHVLGTYRSMKSNKEWELAIYKKPTMPLGWQRDFNLTKKGITIWGKPITYKSMKIPQSIWMDSKLKKIKDIWYLCLSIEIDIPNTKTNGIIIGVDSGIKNLLVAINKKTNKTLYVDGGELNHRRLCIRQTRKKVVRVGTRSAYRLLKRLSGREKSVTQLLLHTASKQLVTFAEENGAKVIVMEDLTGIRKSSRKPKKGQKSNQNHKQRAKNNRWPFAKCQFYINYKALAKGIGFELVSPINTSRACPECGHTEEANRNGLVFRCKSCNYQDNADRVGATNIALRSLFQRQGVEKRAVCQLAYSSHEGDCSSELQASAFRQG